MSKFIPSKVKDFFKSMRPPPTNVVLAAAKGVTSPSMKPHVPMIKFRKSGGLAGHSSPPIQGAGAAAIQIGNVSPTKTSGKANTSVLIEDWQLPNRYRRRPLDQQEIDYINRGGPE